MLQVLRRNQSDVRDMKLLALDLEIFACHVQPHFRRKESVQIEISLLGIVMQSDLWTGIENEQLQKMLNDAPCNCR